MVNNQCLRIRHKRTHPLNLNILSIFSLVTARKRSLGQGNIFTPVCHSVQGGHALLLRGGGVSVVAGVMHGCSGGGGGRGACMVALGGMRGCSGGHAWLLPGGHAWDMTTHGDTVNERAVRILLECILVIEMKRVELYQYG